MTSSRRSFPHACAVFAGLILLAACAPAGEVPVTGLEMTPAASATPTSDLPAPTPLPPVAVLAAQSWLAASLGVSVREVDIRSMEQAEWSDSCLGLGGPSESCLQVITPGWTMEFEAVGKVFKVRTNESGSVIRLEGGAPPGAAGDLLHAEWRLESFAVVGDGASVTPALEGATVTLEFQFGGQAAGSGGCNSYGARYQTLDGHVSLKEIITTEIACSGDGIMEQEQRFYAALEAAGRYAVAGTELKLWYDGGRSVMTFSKSMPGIPPTASVELEIEKIEWSLLYFGPQGAEMPLGEGSRVTLMLADGQAGGSGGCNTYGAGYEADGSDLSFVEIFSTLRACADARVTEQEQRFLEALRTADHYVIHGRILRITYDDGRGVLVFTAPLPEGPTDATPAPGG